MNLSSQFRINLKGFSGSSITWQCLVVCPRITEVDWVLQQLEAKRDKGNVWKEVRVDEGFWGLPHLVRKVLECIPQSRGRVLLGSLEELVRWACDEGLEEAHGAEYLLSFGCVLWRVVDTLVGSAEAVEEEKKNTKQNINSELTDSKRPALHFHETKATQDRCSSNVFKSLCWFSLCLNATGVCQN